jgi:hypothetical protein
MNIKHLKIISNIYKQSKIQSEVTKLKIEKLKAGQIYKNYKALCEVLEIEVKKSTNSKNAQLKDLSLYCNYSKIGHQFTIHEVYDEPLERIENRGKSEGSRNNNSVYSNAIQLLIADLLAQCKGHVSISRSRLMLRIGMTNSNYSECGESVKKLSKYTKVDEKVIYDFYNTSNSNFKSTIESALNSLMDKRVIMYSTVTKICEKGDYSPRTADQDEIDIIMDFEKQTLEKLGYKHMSVVRVSRDWKKFRSEVQKLLHEFSDIEYYYTAYDINVNEKYIEQERNELAELLLEEVKRKEYKDELNSTVYENLYNNAKKRHNKEQNTWGKSKNKMGEIRRSESYIEDVKRLANLLISKDTPSFIDEVRKIELNPVITQEERDLLDSQCDDLFG